jgi:3-oxoacyl-[acyl-carrier protein] reductase
MDLGVKGKTALVLASSRGLGQAMAVALAREGVKVAVTGRNAEGLQQTVQMIEAMGGKALALNWDLANLDSVDNIFNKSSPSWGPLIS